MPTLPQINKRLEDISELSGLISYRITRKNQRELLAMFQASYKELDAIISNLFKRIETLSINEMAKYNRLKKLQAELIEVTKGLIPKSNGMILKSNNENLLTGYYTQGYAWETSIAADLGFTQINSGAVVAATSNEYGLIKWQNSTRQNVYKYRNDIRFAVTQGVIQGDSYYKMTRRVRKATARSSYGIMRIMRTEGGKAMSVGQLVGMDKVSRAAGASSFEVVKFWIATLDQNTRLNHSDADGQTRPLDKNFSVGGASMPAPRLSGDPAQDINCRCATGTKIGKIKNKYRFDNIAKRPIINKTYKEWAKSKSIKIS